jgi:hypothetical protein
MFPVILYSILLICPRVVLDARLGREILEGYAITAIFMTEDLVSRFKLPPMLLPSRPLLKDKVAEMQGQCRTVRLNFEFKDSTDHTDV